MEKAETWSWEFDNDYRMGKKTKKHLAHHGSECYSYFTIAHGWEALGGFVTLFIYSLETGLVFTVQTQDTAWAVMTCNADCPALLGNRGCLTWGSLDWTHICILNSDLLSNTPAGSGCSYYEDTAVHFFPRILSGEFMSNNAQLVLDVFKYE